MAIRHIKDKERGNLLSIELEWLEEFEPRRMFVVSDVPAGTVRGGHAHHETAQKLVCASGELELMVDDGKIKKSFKLSPGRSYYHKPLEWLTVKFVEKNSVMISLCSHEYDEEDYIRDYDDFLEVLKHEKK